MKECCKLYLDEQFDGDADVTAEVYAEYASSVQGKMDEAGAALAASDWPQLDKIAHTIKGNALAAGDKETAETAISLRKVAALGDAALAAPLVDRLKELAKEL